MKTAATGQPPIERALKTDVLTIGGIPTAILTDDDDDMVEWSTVDIDTQENKKSALDLTKKYPKHHIFLSNQEPAVDSEQSSLYYLIVYDTARRMPNKTRTTTNNNAGWYTQQRAERVFYLEKGAGCARSNLVRPVTWPSGRLVWSGLAVPISSNQSIAVGKNSGF